jgi:branched-chain amino acid transport system ATP-binding protein
MSALLHIDRCTVAFGGLVALDAVSLEVKVGEIVGLIGPNGAGKTTAFNLITGICRPVSKRLATAEVEAGREKSTHVITVDYGDVTFDGRSIRGKPPHAIASRGIARTFQNIRLFPNLTALDNVRIACTMRGRCTLAEAVLRTRGLREEEHDIRLRAIHMLHVFGLGKFQDELALNLPYGEQRRLEIARALATSPKLILLDEPAAGMNPHESHDLMALIKSIRSDFGVTILLIEHDMKVVMGICERIYVLDYGEVIAQGDPQMIRNDPKVIQAYLGDE